MSIEIQKIIAFGLLLFFVGFAIGIKIGYKNGVNDAIDVIIKKFEEVCNELNNKQ